MTAKEAQITSGSSWDHDAENLNPQWEAHHHLVQRKLIRCALLRSIPASDLLMKAGYCPLTSAIMAVVNLSQEPDPFLSRYTIHSPLVTFINATLGYGLLCSIRRHVQHLQDCTGFIIYNCFNFPDPQFRVMYAVSLSKELTCPEGHMPTHRYGCWRLMLPVIRQTWQG